MIAILSATAALNAGNAARLSATAGMMGSRRLRGAESPTQTQELMRPMEPMRPAEPERDFAADYAYYAELQTRMRKPVLDFDAWKALETVPRRA